MHPPVNDDVVRYTMLDETGQHGVLLFGCEKCPPEKKLTSSMLEAHMRDRHDSARFTVSVPSPVTDLEAITNVDGVLTKEIPERREDGQGRGEGRRVPNQRGPRTEYGGRRSS